MEESQIEVRLEGAGLSGVGPGQGLSRAQMLRRVSGAGAVLCVGGVAITGLASLATSAGSRSADERILNFALVLEHLQQAYYSEAAASGALGDASREFATVAARHESEHIAALMGLLGDAAQDPPTFDFGDTTSDEAAFLKVATSLEDLGVAAYNGQAANLTRRALAQTSRIASVDGRHAAWIRALAGEVPAPDTVDPGRTAKAVQAAIDGTGFIVGGG